MAHKKGFMLRFYTRLKARLCKSFATYEKIMWNFKGLASVLWYQKNGEFVMRAHLGNSLDPNAPAGQVKYGLVVPR